MTHSVHAGRLESGCFPSTIVAGAALVVLLADLLPRRKHVGVTFRSVIALLGLVGRGIDCATAVRT